MTAYEPINYDALLPHPTINSFLTEAKQEWEKNPSDSLHDDLVEELAAYLLELGGIDELRLIATPDGDEYEPDDQAHYDDAITTAYTLLGEAGVNPHG